MMKKLLLLILCSLSLTSFAIDDEVSENERHLMDCFIVQDDIMRKIIRCENSEVICYVYLAPDANAERMQCFPQGSI